MAGSVSVIIVCHGSLIREAIIDTLETDGIEIVWSGDSLESLARDDLGSCVGIYVASGLSERQEREEAARMLSFDLRNWLILCDDKRNSFCRGLLTQNRSLSTAPIDVTRLDLVQLVRLAARNRRMCVDSMCDRCPATVIDPLAEMSLSNDHLKLMRYLSEGLSNKQIARIDGCSESLVKVHMRTLLEKLHVQNRTQAAVLAARSGLTYRPSTPV